MLTLSMTMLTPLALAGCGGGPRAKAESAQNDARAAQETANRALAKTDALEHKQNEVLNRADAAQQTANQAAREANNAQ
ncbi:hypothetical protein RIE95_05735 [Acidithiobacillus thiooxidans]|uniref:hypothetical protein n=1 Tax=Acidithiobacillus thiooxidans TaxID=930 RepID=UPI002855D834|nr:hypothetical protein [Acidithiobacillus thiooxidans]MDR7926494.1 hypothetical protein [Acidithiobacillus thiooxidans]